MASDFASKSTFGTISSAKGMRKLLPHPSQEMRPNSGSQAQSAQQSMPLALLRFSVRIIRRRHRHSQRVIHPRSFVHV